MCAYSTEVVKTLRYAIKSQGLTCMEVSKRVGSNQSGYISRRLLQGIGEKLLTRVLAAIDVSATDFWAAVDGRVGDPKIHLARWIKEAPGRIENAMRSPPRENPKRLRRLKMSNRGIWDLDINEHPLMEVIGVARWFAFNGTKEESIEGWSIYGVASRRAGNPKKAAYCYLRAFLSSEVDTKSYGINLLRVSYLAQHLGEFDLAESCIRKSLEIFGVLGESEWLGRALIDMGKASLYRGENGEALKTFTLGRRLATERSYITLANQGSGTALLRLGAPERGLEFGRKALGLAKGAEFFQVHLLLGDCHQLLGDTSSALEYYERASETGKFWDIYVGDRLELSLRSVRCYLANRRFDKAAGEAAVFNDLAVLISEKFARGYKFELSRIIRQKERSVVIDSLQQKLTEEVRQKTNAVRFAPA